MAQEDGFDSLVSDLDELLETPTAFENLLDEALLCTESISPDPKVKPTKDETESEEDGKGKPKKKKERLSNAERCRKHRERKRAEEKKVFLENISLKRERMEMLEQITELEFQAQALRGQGYMDLTVENQLLRQEIKKHRQYVQKIIDLTTSGMEDTSEEEHDRVMKSCVESAIGQMVGLSYSSLVDPTWKRGMSFMLLLDEKESIQCQADIRFQCLPVGTNPKNALRINVRFDLAGFPMNAELVSQHLTRLGTDVAELRKQYDETHLHYGLSIDEVFPHRIIAGNTFGCFRFVHSFGQSNVASMMVSSSKEVAMYPEAFPADVRKEEEDENARLLVKVHAASTCNLLSPEENTLKEEAQRMEDLVTKALILKDEGPASCHMTSIGTVSTQMLKGFVEPLISEDGQLSQQYQHSTAVVWQRIFSDCRDRMKPS